MALERPLLRVSPSYVDIQVALLAGAIGALIALERFLLRVHPFVCSQVALNAEALGALATLERPFPRVNPFVPSQVALVAESLGACLALERPFPRVDPFVYNQGARRYTYALAAWPVAYDGHSLVGH